MEGLGQVNNKNEILTSKENVEISTTPKIEENNEYKLEEISNNINKEQAIIDNTTSEVDRIRKDLGLDGMESNIPSIEVNKAKKSKFENVLNTISSSVSSVGKFAKIGTLGASLFVGGNNVEANNFNQNVNDRIDQGIENATNIENEKDKTLNGGNIEEVVVYGKKKYEEELTKQQENIKKFEAEMAKYQKDSIEWVKANEAYQDSLKLYSESESGKKLFSKEFDWEKLGPTFSEDEVINKIKKLNPELKKYRASSGRLIYGNYKLTRGKEKDGKPWSIGENQYQDMPDEYQKRNLKIKPVGWQPKIYSDENYDPKRLYDYEAVYKKPTNEPIPPQRPENIANKEIKYDPKFENLHMRSLWPAILKQDTNAKIGTLHVLDPKFEKGFTLEEAMTFPQEIKDQYNIDYIYNQIHNKEKSTNEDYKHPGWEYNNPAK